MAKNQYAVLIRGGLAYLLIPSTYSENAIPIVPHKPS